MYASLTTDPSTPPIPANESERLEALRHLGILDTPAEPEYDDLARLAAIICGTPMSLVSLVDMDRQWYKAKVGIDGTQAGRDIAFCAHVIAQDELFIVADALEDERFRDNPFVTGDANVRFYAGMPLTTDAGHNLGSLCVLDREPRHLSETQLYALRVLSRQVVTHLQLRAQVQEVNRTQIALSASEAKFRSTIEHLADGVCIVDVSKGQFIDANSAMLSMLGYSLPEFVALDPFGIVANESREEFLANIQRVWRDLAEQGMSDVGRRFYRRKDGSVITVSIRVSVVPDCAQELHAVIVRDVTEEDRIQSALRDSEQRFRAFMDNSPIVAFMKDEEGRYTYINEPLVRKFGFPKQQWIGQTDAQLFPLDFSSSWRENDLTVLQSGKPTEFDETTPRPDGSLTHWSTYKFPFRDDEGSLYLAGIGLDVTEKVNAEHSLREANSKLRALSVTDALTTVRNRAAFDDHISEEYDRALRRNSPLSVVMLDVDHFKLYNDSFGHPAGDAVLKQVAETLQATARTGDVVARYGGEEFAMILPDTDYAGSIVIAERCRKAIASRVWSRRAITVSVGVATRTSDSTSDSLIESADMALYKSKALGRNRVVHAQSLEIELRLQSK